MVQIVGSLIFLTDEDYYTHFQANVNKFFSNTRFLFSEHCKASLIKHSGQRHLQT